MNRVSPELEARLIALIESMTSPHELRGYHHYDEARAIKAGIAAEQAALARQESPPMTAARLRELADRCEAAEREAIGELDLALVTASYEGGFPIYGQKVSYDPAMWLERYGPVSDSIAAAISAMGDDWNLFLGWDYERREAAACVGPNAPDFALGEATVSALRADDGLALAAWSAALRARARAMEGE